MVRLVSRVGGNVHHIVFSPDGRTVVTNHWGGTLQFWDPVTGEERLSLRHQTDAIRYLTFSPDGTTLATSGSRGFGSGARRGTAPGRRFPEIREEISLTLLHPLRIVKGKKSVCVAIYGNLLHVKKLLKRLRNS
jgi:hypothetical protein